jgi:hypothetical protein
MPGPVRARHTAYIAVIITAVQLVPAFLSLVLLGAHFFRSGQFALVGVVLAAAALLMVRRPFAGYTLQALLVLGALEWFRTTMVLVAERQQAGLPYTGLWATLIFVSCFTLVSALMLQTRRVSAYFERRPPDPAPTR